MTVFIVTTVEPFHEIALDSTDFPDYGEFRSFAMGGMLAVIITISGRVRKNRKFFKVTFLENFVNLKKNRIVQNILYFFSNSHIRYLFDSWFTQRNRWKK